MIRVTEVDAFRRWKDNEEATASDFLAYLRRETPPSDAMLAGTAFHKGLEIAHPGEMIAIVMDGFFFDLSQLDCSLQLPEVREVRAEKSYRVNGRDVAVTGQVDAIHGLTVYDHKTTANFDADRYLSTYQWRLYLDIFDCTAFQWNVFEIKETGPREYVVRAVHELRQHSYRHMRQDIERELSGLVDFLAEHMPEKLRGEAF